MRCYGTKKARPMIENYFYNKFLMEFFGIVATILAPLYYILILYFETTVERVVIL